MVLLSMTTISVTDDHFLGLGRTSVRPSELILALRIMMGCGTVDRALNSLVRFHEVGNPISMGLRTDGPETQLWVSCDEVFGGANGPAIEDIYLNTVFGGLCYFLGRRFPAIAVSTRNFTQPINSDHWSMFAPVRCGQLAALHFPTWALRELRQGDPADDLCWEILKHRIALDESKQTALSGEAVSLRQLNSNILSYELGISTATFRRRNQASGSTFRRFREETLVEASLAFLADETKSIAWIAAQLGYADVRSYRRFVKGATGLTPDQLRVESRAKAMEDVQPKIAAAIKDISIQLSQ